MESSSLVGCIVISMFPYYDSFSRSTKFKKRPFLVLKAERDELPCDFTVLPVSKIGIPENIHPVYDYYVRRCDFPKAKLTCDSYIRAHKISSINENSDDHKISNLKEHYPENFSEIVELSRLYLRDIV